MLLILHGHTDISHHDLNLVCVFNWSNRDLKFQYYWLTEELIKRRQDWIFSSSLSCLLSLRRIRCWWRRSWTTWTLTKTTRWTSMSLLCWWLRSPSPAMTSSKSRRRKTSKCLQKSNCTPTVNLYQQFKKCLKMSKQYSKCPISWINCISISHCIGLWM